MRFLQIISSLNVKRTRDVVSVYTFAVCYRCVALYVGLDVQSRVVFLLGLWLHWLCVYLLSLQLYLFGVRLPQIICALDICCPTLGLCSFDVNQTRCAALWYVGLYIQSRIVLLPGVCTLDICCPSLGLCAFDVNRTRCAALRYVFQYV